MLLLAAGLLCFCISASIIRNILKSRMYMTSLPASISWIGVRDESLPKVRACVRELFAGLRNLQAGYAKFCKSGRMFVIPDPGFRPQVMIPQKDLAWFAEQPETSLSARGPQVGRFAVDILAPTLDVTHDGYMIELLRKDFTRNLGRLQPDIVKDLKLGLEECIGLAVNDWQEFNVWKTMETLIFRSTLRMFVGPTLSENTRFRNAIAAFATFLGSGAVVVGQLTPAVLKPLLGYTFAIPIFVSQKIAFFYMVPQIKERLQNFQRKQRDSSFEWNEPRDMMMWMIRASLERQDVHMSQPNQIAERLLFLILGAIHTTIMTSTNVVLDLLSSPEEYGYIGQLRREADEIFKNEEDWCIHANVAKLIHADSAIRETLRKSPVLTRVVLREVVKKDGIVFPDGQHLPQGTWIGVPTLGVHLDEAFYERPQVYDPFRFVRPNTEVQVDVEKQVLGAEAGNPANGGKSIHRQAGAATASDTYIAWGYGRHSCPGRWFAVMQLKLFLALLISRYEFEPLTSRPLNGVFGDSIIPSTHATIKLRTRTA